MNDQRVLDLIEANKEAERYAGKMETALEHIVTVCRLGRYAERVELHSVLDLIGALAQVKDDRITVGKHAPKQG